MRRRRFLRSGSALAAGLLAGCADAPGGADPTTTHDPARVTTTGGDSIELLAAQLVVREADDGPRVHYRLRNGGTEPATVALRTVLTIEGGGTYEATGYTDVAAGGEVVVEYRLVRYAALTERERTSVRRGDAELELYVNGHRRPGV